MRATIYFSLLLLLLPTTGCQTGRDGFLSRGTEQISRSLGMSRTKDSERLAAARALEDLPVAQARSLERKGDLARAEAIYRRALEADPNHAVAAHRLAVIADQRGDFEKSARYFEQAVSIDADNPDVRCDYGYSLYRQSRWRDAEDQFQRALTVDAQHARTHNNHGLLLARTGRPDEALTAFREAGCSQSESRMNLAFVLASEGMTDLAQQQLDQVGRNILTPAATRERMEHLQQWITHVAAHAPSQVPVSSPMQPAHLGDSDHRLVSFHEHPSVKPPQGPAPNEPVQGYDPGGPTQGTREPGSPQWPQTPDGFRR